MNLFKQEKLDKNLNESWVGIKDADQNGKTAYLQQRTKDDIRNHASAIELNQVWLNLPLDQNGRRPTKTSKF